MLNALRRLFDPPAETGTEDAEHQVRVAAAVLLLEVSRVDFSVEESELRMVARALREHFGLNDEELEQLLEIAQQRSRESHSLHPFLRRINEHFTPEQKARMVEHLWRVALADGRLDKYEEYHIRRIADLLYVPHSVFIRGKHRARRPHSKGHGA
jgi:uncharacterized tellurite resistance protein B-like protein